ncbi:uncharacterized protein L3040_008395 [Drepanopeziza brunnea f. sp. 'multigermtubi']|uniref:uncharacterized protein n=1 Tax=Drepanopeziza brunnea f. sp. 'multigermtubi' TaxID=698441 RepID=UPI0023A25B3E|nr:hypothetical protein L3040_008395 [Drepanopeziza brunnea f. sp. 'multigermtubi']
MWMLALGDPGEGTAVHAPPRSSYHGTGVSITPRGCLKSLVSTLNPLVSLPSRDNTYAWDVVLQIISLISLEGKSNKMPPFLVCSMFPVRIDLNGMPC